MASVDVIIPNYNYARFLPECVHSILSQDMSDLRIIIIDNASTDGSVDVARQLAKQHSAIELICHASNQGPHASFNEGIDVASADYVLILCSDDILSEGGLRRAKEALERNPQAAFAVGPETNTDEYDTHSRQTVASSWNLVEGDVFIRRCIRTLGHGLGYGSVLVRTGAQKAAGHYRPSLPYTDDLEMLLRLAQLGDVIEMAKPIGVRREHSSNMTKSFCHDRIRDLREREAAFESFFTEATTGPYGVPASARRVARKCLAEAAFWSSVSHLFRGKTELAVNLYLYGFRLSPVSMVLPPVGHLLRQRGTFTRIREVISEMIASKRRSADAIAPPSAAE
jgi:glycosyltransferase involved in cell wall biosynthesis